MSDRAAGDKGESDDYTGDNGAGDNSEGGGFARYGRADDWAQRDVGAMPIVPHPISYVRNPYEGTTFSIGAMLVTLKTTGDETEGRFALIEVTIPPYFADILPHFHRESSEAIYLTQGMLAVTLGDETMVVRQGSFILIPPHVVHRLWNPAATQATFLAYYSPAGVEGFFAALAELDLPAKPHQVGALAELWAMGRAFDHFAPE